MDNTTQLSFDYNSCFKSIYYQLYSNSSTSRAERIVSDITKVLLCKLIAEQDNIQNISSFSGKELLRMLKEKYPQSCEQYDDFSLSNGDIAVVLNTLSNISLFSEYSSLNEDFAKQELENILTLVNVWRYVLDNQPKGCAIAYDSKQKYRKGTNYFCDTLSKAVTAVNGTLLKGNKHAYIIVDYNMEEDNIQYEKESVY